MKRIRAIALWEFLVVLAIIGILAAILFPIFARPKHHYPSNCQSNLKQIGLAMMMYAQDYNERMPLIAVNAISKNVDNQTPYGWADALQLYIKSTQVYQCRYEETLGTQAGDVMLPNYTDYYFNTNLSGLKTDTKTIPLPASTLMLGEGNDGTDGSDARYNRNSLPQTWIDTKNSPARRHLDGANYAFVDGHVKWYKPSQVSNGRGAPSANFGVR